MESSHDQSGQVMVLVVGLSLIAFAVAGLAIDGTRALLYRRTLQNAADAAALAGADAIDRRTYYSSGGARIEIDVVQARRAASASLSRRGIMARAHIETRPREMAVTIRGTIRTTFLRLIGLRLLPVAATAHAAPIPGG